MRLSARIVVPAAAALLTAAGILAFLFLELQDIRALLSAQLLPSADEGMTSNTTLPPLAESTDEALLMLRRGDIAVLRGDWATAADAYDKAVRAGAGVTGLKKLATARLQQQDIRGAQTVLDDMRRSNAAAEDLLLLESGIALRTGELQKARQMLEGASESPHKHYGLALLAIMTEDHETAKKELLNVSGGWEPVLRASARTLLSAYDEYALFQGSPPIHLLTLLGRGLAQVQECELALPLLARVTQAQDDYRDAWLVRGFCELSTNRPMEALASLERAYQIDPEKPETQYFLARAYIGRKEHGKALTFLQYALKNGFTPEAEVRRLIAQEALETGNATLALEQLEALTRAQDATADAYQEYVTAALAAGLKEEALAKAQEAAEQWPASAPVQEILGWAQAEAGRTEEARQSLTKALELDPRLASARERLEKL